MEKTPKPLNPSEPVGSVYRGDPEPTHDRSVLLPDDVLDERLAVLERWMEEDREFRSHNELSRRGG